MPQLLLGELDLLAAPFTAFVGTSWGMWQAITTTTDSRFLDGAMVAGEQSGNRAIALQVRITGTVRPTLVRACEQLFAEANKPANTLTFVPDEGQRVVYEVFRAQPERTDDESEAWGYRTYTFTFPAMPFARSDQRTSTGALAPAVTLVNFESPVTGILVGSGARSVQGSEFGMPYDSSLAESSWLQVARPPSMTADAGCTVANGATVTTGNGAVSCATATATAAGVAEFHVTAAASASTASAVTAGVNIFWAASVARKFQVGVEWLNSSGVTVGVDWGAAQSGRASSPNTFSAARDSGGTIWATAVKPATATQVRLRVRVPAAQAGDAYPVLGSAIIPVTVGTVPTTSSQSHDGTASVLVQAAPLNPTEGGSNTVNPQGSGFLRVALPAAANVSAKPRLQAWIKNAASMGVASLRLLDASGKWSRWDSYTASPLGADGWQSLVWMMASPSQVATAGGVDLTAVTAVEVSIVQDWTGSSSYLYVDSIAAVDLATATTSPRGSVYDLSVVGSARSTAQVALTGATPLTDFLVAAIATDSENPLLAVSSNVAASPAPGTYDGVYSIVGAVAPAASLTSPSCVVAQLINGTQVASTTLTGIQATGNHYVDFGQVALPLVAVPAENASVSYAFTLTPSSANWAEVLVLNADAPLTWVQNLTTSRAYAWVDEPVLPAQVGRIYVGSASDRTDARAVLSPPVQSRPFQVAAPTTRLLVYSTTTGPGVTLSYFPRWLVEPDA